MCLSAEASFTAAAILMPAGVLSTHRAWQADRRYLVISALPFLFGVQQATEGLVWTAGQWGDQDLVTRYSLAYMFFTWLAWPVGAPVSTYFIEEGRRRSLYLFFAIAGGMLGALQYVPYFAHEGWLTTTFLARAVRYQDVNLLDFVVTRETTYVIYAVLVTVPFLLSRDRAVKVFGLLVVGVLAVTYIFFAYAYISVFCFGGALMSLYLVAMIPRKPRSKSAMCTA